jgi:hypothetical protein
LYKSFITNYHISEGKIMRITVISAYFKYYMSFYFSWKILYPQSENWNLPCVMVGNSQSPKRTRQAWQDHNTEMGNLGQGADRESIQRQTQLKCGDALYMRNLNI